MRISFRNLFIWLIFGLALSLMPLIFKFFKIYYLESKTNNYWNALKIVIAHGELLITTIAALGRGAGEIFKEEPKSEFFKILIGGGTFFLSILTIYFYLDFSSTLHSYDIEKIYNLSMGLFTAAVIFTISSFIVPRKN